MRKKMDKVQFFSYLKRLSKCETIVQLIFVINRNTLDSWVVSRILILQFIKNFQCWPPENPCNASDMKSIVKYCKIFCQNIFPRRFTNFSKLCERDILACCWEKYLQENVQRMGCLFEQITLLFLNQLVIYDHSVLTKMF